MLKKDSVAVYDRYGEPVKKRAMHVDWDVSAAEKGGYAHFMLKEIMEQPQVIRDTIRPRISGGRIDLGLKHISQGDFKNADRVYIVACGSAHYVGQVARHYIETLAKVPVSVELASEFRYMDPLVTERTIAVIISQSGETIDTLFALREAKRWGAKVVSIVNVGGQHHRQRERGRDLHLGGPGNRRGYHKGIQRPAGGLLPAGAAHGPLPEYDFHGTAGCKPFISWRSFRI